MVIFKEQMIFKIYL